MGTLTWTTSVSRDVAVRAGGGRMGRRVCRVLPRWSSRTTPGRARRLLLALRLALPTGLAGSMARPALQA